MTTHYAQPAGLARNCPACDWVSTLYAHPCMPGPPACARWQEQRRRPGHSLAQCTAPLHDPTNQEDSA